MAYTAWSVTFGEVPTAAKWNQLGTNDAHFYSFLGDNLALQSFTASPTGFSGTPTTTNCKYGRVGNLVFMHPEIVGTSNATTFGFTAPVAPRYADRIAIPIEDNTAFPTAMGLLELTASSTSVTVKSTLAGGAFTASNEKGIRPCIVVYEAA